MSDRIIIKTENASDYVDHDRFRYCGSEGDLLQIDVDGAVYARVWQTNLGNVAVNIDHEKTNIDDAEIVESKLYRDTNNE